MKKLMLGLSVVGLVAGGQILLGQGQGQGQGQDPDHDPFFARNHRGELVHVLPTPAAIRNQSDRQDVDAPPSNEATVYRASYGAGSLNDHGGLEIAGAEFQPIYWNDDVANSTATSTLNNHHFLTISEQIGSFIGAFTSPSNWTDIVTSDYDIVQQYGSHASIASSLAGSPAGNSQRTAVGVISDADVQTYLDGIFNGADPHVNLVAKANVIYGLYFPANMQVTLGSAASCTDFCGYHGHFTHGSGSTAIEIKYAVFPYLNCTACKLTSKTVADMLTIVTSHEIREAVTDPGDNNVDAWYDLVGYEADDKCAWHNLYQMSNGGFWVQPEYSNGGNVTRSGFNATYPGPGCVVPTSVSGGGHGHGKGH